MRLPFRTWIRSINIITAAWMLAVTAIAWWWLYSDQTPMASMHAPSITNGTDLFTVLGMQVGRPVVMAIKMFLAMWPGMVVAMMFPAAVPLVSAHRAVTRLHGTRGLAATAALILGYIVIWLLAALIPLTGLAARYWLLPPHTDHGPWPAAIAAVSLIFAGLYQFSRVKTRCLVRCRSPLIFILRHDFNGGAASAFGAGVRNGLFCVGCCWALMTTQIAIGLDNLAWMGVLTVVILAERIMKGGNLPARAAGGVMLGGGLALFIMSLMHIPASGVLG